MSETLRSPLSIQALLLRVLVVEDDPASQFVIENMLCSLGISFDIVADGAQALTALKTIAYDVVLLYLELPGVDGIGVASENGKNRTLSRLQRP